MFFLHKNVINFSIGKEFSKICKFKRIELNVLVKKKIAKKFTKQITCASCAEIN